MLTFTKNAARKVFELIQDENDYELNLRVYVTGGGCSGFQYGFTFDKEISAEDTVVAQNVESHQVKLLIDPLSFTYLSGAEIDYAEDDAGDHFLIRNPNAKTTCGCGSSFTVDETK